MLRNIKNKIHIKFPGTIALYERIRHFRNRNKKMIDIFSNIHKRNGWKDPETISGRGSTFKATMILRRELPVLLKKYNIRSLVDAPCGDFHWMSKAELELNKYVGIDVVDEIISSNKRIYGDECHKFEKNDVTLSPTPQADLILCRDLLIHFSYKDIYRTIINFQLSGSTYLLTTTYLRLNKNNEGINGGWRPINLQIAPFNFGKPIALISEEENDEYAKPLGKHLGLWLLKDIPTINV